MIPENPAVGIGLSPLGFGAAPIGNLYQPVEDVVASAAVTAAWESGIRYFDTAPHYGFGLSEQRLGDALKLFPRDEMVLSTKVGRRLKHIEEAGFYRHGFAGAPAFEPVFDYTYDGVMQSFESSLQRLQMNRIDLLLVHDPGRETHGKAYNACLHDFLNGGYRAMAELKEQGLVRALGIGANEWQIGEELLTHIDLDYMLLAGRYTLLEQEVCDSFFSLCHRRSVSIIAGGPFNSGILASGSANRGTAYYNYEPAPEHIIQRVQKLEAICREFDIPLAAAALQFPAAHPCVSSVLAGFTNKEQVQTATHLMQVYIPMGFWQRLIDQALIHPEAPVPDQTSSFALLKTSD